MQATAESSERLVCAVLAAQVAVIRDRFYTEATVCLLWRTADILSRLSSLVPVLLDRIPVRDAALDEQCSAAVAAEAEIALAIDGLAFVQAQRDDFGRQMADCVVTALERLAAAGAAPVARISPGDLAELYICDDQRTVHESVIRRFNAIKSKDARPSGTVRHPDDGAGA
jgi:hypothetical protein